MGPKGLFDPTSGGGGGGGGGVTSVAVETRRTSVSSPGLVVMEAVLALLRGAGMGQQASRLQKEQKFNHRAFNLEGNLGVTA